MPRAAAALTCRLATTVARPPPRRSIATESAAAPLEWNAAGTRSPVNTRRLGTVTSVGGVAPCTRNVETTRR